MSEKKIVIPTEEEVAEYTAQGKKPDGTQGDGQSASQNAAAQPADAQPAAQPEAPGSARSELEEYKDKYLRSMAELSNYRRRAEKDREESLRYANIGLARSLLPVLDNLERVVASAEEHPDNTAAILDGVKLTIESFKKAFADHHIAPIEAQDQPFDPAVHEALMQQPSDKHDTPTILQVLQQGYRLFDRVIRPARVIVSKPAQGEKSE